MFEKIENSRSHFKQVYFYPSQSWHQELDTTEKNNRDEIIFNRDTNKFYPQTEYFTRKARRLKGK